MTAREPVVPGPWSVIVNDAHATLFDNPKSAAIYMPWRMGRSIGRTVYAQIGDEPSDDDVLIGVMDSRILAADVVASHNAVLASRPRESNSPSVPRP